MSQNCENLCDIDRNNNSSITVVEFDKPTNSLNTESDSENDSITIKNNNSDIEDTNKLNNYSSKNLSIWRKRLILLILSIAAMISPMADSILYPALVQICSDFQAPEIFVNILAAIFMFFMGFGQIGWAAFSESFETRRRVYLICMPLILISCVICALTPNIWLLIVGRGIQGCGTSSLVVIGSGIIADIYELTERGSAFGIFYVIYTFAVLLGPLFGGYFTQYFGWRSIFWYLAIMTGVVYIAILLFVPETFNSNNSNESNESDVEGSETSEVKSSPSRKIFNPFLPFKLLRYPNVTICVLYISLFCTFCDIQPLVASKNFPKKYGVSTSTLGLLFIPSGIGLMVGSFIGGKYSDLVIKWKKSKQNDDESIQPEVRINSIWIATLIVPAANILYGWLFEREIHIAVFLVLWSLGNFGVFFIFNIISTYLVDSNRSKSASVIAVFHCVRLFLEACVSMLEAPLEEYLGIKWMFTLFGLIMLLSNLLIIAVFFKGRSWREKIDK
ncbi:major facilitator superfamily domain-containing protein [Gigaspora rosea]|uniref:Major facilitator superfamily domain-containing protein n=1 Tax=Gigaspora rosea TaxID=44941 RepID=A0A397UVV1_9GLOM|nr:major facilitator superfamily domain-containing protein [Gigaspora rosea]CAG8510738.1 24894_t:CDS:2 [Gigaspora rosea]